MYKLKNYPLIQQLNNYDCGVAVTQSILLYNDKYIKYSDLEAKLKTTKEDGTPPENIIGVLEKYNFKCKESTHIEEIQMNLLYNQPSIILIELKNDTHYNSVIGFDQKGFVLHDPCKKRIVNIPYEKFIKKWYENYTIIIKNGN